MLVFFNDDSIDEDAVVISPFDELPFFLHPLSCECVAAYVGTKVCYTDETLSETCDCFDPECAELEYSIGKGILRGVADESSDDSACVDVCKMLT